MSSLFWFGENSRRHFDDVHPEVHHSDGLAMRMSTGERLWRPLNNDSGKLEISFFNSEKCDGFGLLQRDRRFAAYEDADANYQIRPSLWVEPTSDWGAGRIVLMEMPTSNGLSDNTMAMWEPSHTPQPGERIEFSYRQCWTTNPDPAQADGFVVATRTGVPDPTREQRSFVIEFTGKTLNQVSEIPLTAHIEAISPGSDKIKIQGVAVQPMPDERWRVTFQISPATDGAKLADIGPIELRGCLKRGENFLTETWAHRVIP
jgi:glucans biosynthesis protein